MQEVVLRCLEKDPAQRFADVGSLEQALAACGCTGQWNEERAALWWQKARGKGSGQPEAKEGPGPEVGNQRLVPI